MSKVIYNLSNKESSNRLKDKLPIIKKLDNVAKVTNILRPAKTIIPSLNDEQCLKERVKRQLDIDIGYAIGLLKKEDQNVNVYSHLRAILDKITLEKPSNPLGNFEKYSRLLKRTYIYKEVNIEHVFVDNISRNECRTNLQVYKHALKIQSQKQMQFINNMQSENLKSIDNTKDNNSSTVQNLWEANYMFNKAGCGLPADEVALISLSMTQMAQSNKFKTIRFWGKIFGLKNNYFIIECEWTEEEKYRKLATVNQMSKLSTDFEVKQDNIISRDSTKNKIIVQEKSKVLSSSVPNKLETLEKPTKRSCKSTETDLNFEMTDSKINDSDNWTFLDENSSSKQISIETTQKIIVPDIIGIGGNKNIYFVTNELNSKWIELESVNPNHIVDTRKIKRFFYGELYEPINGFPKFNGLEIDYLRAQIARISSNTQICPHGYYKIDKMENNNDKFSNIPLSSVSTNSIKRNHVNLVLNKNFKPIPNYNLMNASYWVHKNVQIGDNGITESSDLPTKFNSFDKVYLYEDEDEDIGYDEFESITEIQDERMLKNLRNDVTFDGTPAWKGVLCSPFDGRNSITMMISHIWPGAYAVAYERKTEYVYIGWGQKQDFTFYCSSLLDEIRMNSSNKNDLIEYDDPLENHKVNNLKNKLTNSNKEKIFSLKILPKGYKGKEKIIKDYTYDY